MNPPQPSQQAINDSLTAVNLAVDPNNWLLQRLDRIEQYAKLNNGSSTRCNQAQAELDLKINDLKAKIEDEFEKILGYRKLVKPIPSFSVIDADKDGKIDPQELAKGMSIDTKVAESILNQYDANNDGVLDNEEYQKLQQQQQQSNAKSIILSSVHSESRNLASFDHADNDGDGKVDTKELAEAMNISTDAAKSIVQEYDANEDGVLDEDEYKKLELSNKQNIIVPTQVASFSAIDKNSDGKIDIDELKEVMGIDEDSAKSIIKKYDADNDGILDENEFRELMLAKAKECEWIRYYDKDNKFHYFYNPNSKQIEWKLPSINTKWHDYNIEEDKDNIDMGRFRISCIYDKYTMKYVLKNVETGQIIPGKPFINN